MAKETEAILRSILLAAKRASSVDEVIMTVEAMCSKEDIDSVNAAIAKYGQEK
ncbi:MAG: hypothetical protein FWE20_04885 [Defluviitaleaceae bacterium]|nr:hypothetical protein [Defluviitaleaceae bacterium]